MTGGKNQGLMADANRQFYPAFPRGVGMVRLPTLARGAGGDSATAGQGRGFYAKGHAESEKILQESYLFEVLALSEE